MGLHLARLHRQGDSDCGHAYLSCPALGQRPHRRAWKRGVVISSLIEAVRCPARVIHGSADAVRPLNNGVRIARGTWARSWSWCRAADAGRGRATPCSSTARRTVCVVAVGGSGVGVDLMRRGMGVVGFVPCLPAVLAAADLAVAQGGLSTCLELTAACVPCLYVPLR